MISRRRAIWLVVLAAVVLVYGFLVWKASSDFIHVRGRYVKRDVDERGLQHLIATTDDGLTLRGSFAEPREPRGVLILFHGIGGERYRSRLREIASWGLVGVSFDFRGHGASDGDVTTFGWDERRDVAAIVGAVRSRWPALKIAGWGISLGGAALCYSGDVARGLDAVVIESVYADIDSAFERRVRWYGSWLAVPFAMPVKWLIEERLDVDPTKLRPCEAIHALDPARTLVVTGSADPWSGPGDLRTLCAALPGCSGHVVEGARHHDVWAVGGEAYCAVVRDFVESRLR